MVVAESLARAFAIVGAAGLVRYRANIEDPKDAGVLLVALALGLMTGTGLVLLAVFSCAFVIGVLWLLESLEPLDRMQFDLTVGTKDASDVRQRVDHALQRKGVQFELRGSSATELRYDVSMPLNKRLGKLTKTIRGFDKRDKISVDWALKKPNKVLQT